MTLPETPQTSPDREAAAAELDLDPKDWVALRAQAHRMLDDMLTHLQTIGEQPIWQAMPHEALERLEEPLPADPQGLERAYADYLRLIQPYTVFNKHPRFWGWVIGTGTVDGMLAGMLSAGLNLNAGGHNLGGTYAELRALEWCKQLFGFPPSASAVLVTGGSVANLVALTVARDAALGTAAEQGLQASGIRLAFYGSTETHNSVPKSLRMIGLGAAGWRPIRVDVDFRLDLQALTDQITRDRVEGIRPACVVANAGTVNTGAIDDLVGLVEICKRERLWLHVDGAFGAIAALSPSLRDLVKGMEQADSLAFDLHKWLHIPYDAGCVLVRDADAHRAPFLQSGSYLTRMDQGPAAMPVLFSDYAPELSRSFRGLKVWMAFKTHGTAIYGRLAEQNVAQARYLAGLITAEPELELLAPVPLNIVCFRYRGHGAAGPDRLNELNRRLLIRIQTEGIAVPSHTMLDGQFAIRVAITNHRSRRADFKALVEAVLLLGRAAETE